MAKITMGLDEWDAFIDKQTKELEKVNDACDRVIAQNNDLNYKVRQLTETCNRQASEIIGYKSTTKMLDDNLCKTQKESRERQETCYKLTGDVAQERQIGETHLKLLIKARALLKSIDGHGYGFSPNDRALYAEVMSG